MYSILKIVFALTINTVIDKITTVWRYQKSIIFYTTAASRVCFQSSVSCPSPCLYIHPWMYRL